MIQYLQPTPLLLTCQPIRSKQFEELTNQRTGHNSSNRTNSDIQSSSDRVSDPQFLQSWRPSLVNIWDSCISLETADTRLSSAGITASQARISVRTLSFYKVYNFADSCISISGWCPFVYCISCIWKRCFKKWLLRVRNWELLKVQSKMGKSKSFWTSQWCMNKIVSCITYDDVSTGIKVHKDAGLVAPCLLIDQFPAIKASDWSPLVAKYTVKDDGGLSPPAGSRWLRSLSRPAEEGVIAPSNRFKVSHLQNGSIQNTALPCVSCLVLHDVR